MEVAAILQPPDAQSAAAMLATAVATRTSLVPEGSGTKVIGVDPERTRPLSTRLLTKGLAHYAGDLVATVPAGITLRDANAALARERQWIALDPRFPDTATIGGIVATNDSGPMRHRYGSPRDLVIGIEVALPSGHVAHSGGRVVKNVAGYDLARLFCGSRGSLGLITSVTFKLAPVPPASCTVVARFGRLNDVSAAALILAAAPALAPSAIELAGPDPRLLVRYDSTPRSAAHMAAVTRTMLQGQAQDVTILEGDAETALWIDHQQVESTTGGMLASLSVLPAITPQALDDVAKLASRFGVTWSIVGRAALGVLRVRSGGDAPAQLQFAVALRTAVSRYGGRVELLSGPAAVLASADPCGPLGSTAAIAFSVKQRFDPAGILPYPWNRG